MITPEQQALLDQKYEDLMEKVKEINPALYRKLRSNELAGSISDKVFVANQDNQLEINLYGFYYGCNIWNKN